MGTVEVRAASHTYGRAEYLLGFLISLGLHVLGALLLINVRASSGDFSPPVVYSVTLEGGKSLGGIMQVAKKVERSPLAPPKQVSAPEERVVPEREPEKEPKREPDEVAPEDAEVSLATPKPVATPKPTAAPKATPAPKPTSKPKPTAKPKATPAKKPQEPTISEINKQLEKALQRYRGESSRGGGTGFGAATLGGSGMGGGLVRPPEFFAYLRVLERHIKDGWRWYDDTTPLRAQVIFKIAPDGGVSDVRISASSGSSTFDDSVIRAIKKASPVPPPPPSVYEQYFQEVRMTFDPRE